MPLQTRPVHPVSPAHRTSLELLLQKKIQKALQMRTAAQQTREKYPLTQHMPFTLTQVSVHRVPLFNIVWESWLLWSNFIFFSPANLKEHPAEIPVVKFFMREAHSICFPFVAFHFIGYLCPWMMKRAIPHPKLPSLDSSLYTATITSFSFISPCSEWIYFEMKA